MHEFIFREWNTPSVPSKYPQSIPKCTGWLENSAAGKLFLGNLIVRMVYRDDMITFCLL